MHLPPEGLTMDIRLIMETASGRRREFAPTGKQMTIGRGHKCDLRIPLHKASREHCKIRLLNGHAYLYDLESMNGTKVNGRKISRIRLKDNDAMEIAGVRFKVEIKSPASGQTMSWLPPLNQLLSETLGDLKRDALADSNGPLAMAGGPDHRTTF